MNLEVENEMLRKKVADLELSNSALRQRATGKMADNYVFKSVAIRSEDIRLINQKYDFKELDNDILSNDNQIVKDRWGRIASDVSSYNLHDPLRLLSLSVFGARKNNSLLTLQDQIQAAELYENLKNIILDAYEERLQNVSDLFERRKNI